MRRHACMAALPAVLAALIAGCGLTRDTTDVGRRGPAGGYLQAHRNLEAPFSLAGGPIRISVVQQAGEALLALPDYRRLDSTVFGSPPMPLAYGGIPILYGVPPVLRTQSQGSYDSLNVLSAFGSRYRMLPSARLSLHALDVTATDAAVSQDSVRLEAGWQDEQGTMYAVVCTTVISSGREYPFFGGVVTNHLIHGFTRIGTPLLPTTFAYVAFWGRGETRKNGESLARDVFIEGMLTENVRGEDNSLVFDRDVSPSTRRFQLLVWPFRVTEDSLLPTQPVTGFLMDDGNELPFWYLTFAELDIQDERITTLYRNGRSYSNTRLSPPPAATTILLTDQLDFVPARVVIRAGETVLWKNTSRFINTVTTDPAKAVDPSNASTPQGAEPFHSGNIPPGETFSYTFKVPGTYRYFSLPYEAAGMVGVVEVR